MEGLHVHVCLLFVSLGNSLVLAFCSVCCCHFQDGKYTQSVAHTDETISLCKRNLVVRVVVVNNVIHTEVTCSSFLAFVRYLDPTWQWFSLISNFM